MSLPDGRDALAWGELIVPPARAPRPEGRLRVMLLGSTNAGLRVLTSLLALEESAPIALVATATDLATSERARISARKRVWRHYDEQARRALVDGFVAASLAGGVPCFTGPVKTPFFHALLGQLDPELIIMCCFGQIVDRAIYQHPRLGMFNFHPSNLRAGQGAGPQPFEDAVQRRLSALVMSLHEVTAEIDGGPVIAESPPITIVRADGSPPASVLAMHEKLSSVCGWMAAELTLTTLARRDGCVPLSRFDACRAMDGALRERLLAPIGGADPAEYDLPPYCAKKLMGITTVAPAPPSGGSN